MSGTFDHHIARLAAGGYLDMQDVRQAQMNRIRDVVRKRNEGISFDETEDEKDEDDYDSKYKDDNLPDIIEEMREAGDFDEHEMTYINMMLETAALAEQAEDRYTRVMGLCKTEPLYDEWLENVFGVSTTLAAQLLAKFGYCENRTKVSQLWAYSGLAPGQERTRGEKLGYDPEARTLAWKVAKQMIMGGDRSRYRVEFYDTYKAKQEARMEAVGGSDADEGEDYEIRQIEQSDGTQIPATYVGGERLFKGTPPNSQGHAELRSNRYLSKKFLKHYFAIARDIKGFDVRDEWVLEHGEHEKRTDSFENPFYAKRAIADPTE